MGSGAVFFKKQPSRIETINDIDGEIINVFNCIRANPEHLARLIAFTPYSRQEYLQDDTNDIANDPFERARRYLLRSWQGHGFRSYCKTGWKNDVAGREFAYAVNDWNKLPERIMKVVCRLKQVQIECLPALDVIRRFNNPNVLIYADPPYLLSTRKMKKQYAYEMTEADHIELLEALLRHSGPVMLSGYDSDLYDNMLEGWHKEQISTLAEKGLPRVETLWMNFDNGLSLYSSQ